MTSRALLRRAVTLLAIVAFAPLPATAQRAKLPLTQDTYDLWRTIQQPRLSADGAWAVYTLSPTMGDGELVARATGASTEHRVARGWTGRPLTSVTGTPFNPQAAEVTADSRFVVFLVYPTKAQLDSARVKKVRAAEQPKNKLAILSLATGAVTTVDRVRGFELARDAGRFVAYQIDADTTAGAGTANAGARGGAANATRTDSTKPAPRRKDPGAPMVLHDLASGADVRVEGVTNYSFDHGGKWLVYTVTGADSLGVDGAYVRELATGRVTPLKVATGNYRSLAIDEAGTQVAFLTDADEWTAEKPRFTLYHASLGGGAPVRGAARARPGPQAATVAVAAGAVGDGDRIAERGRVAFVKDGGVLQFGIQPVPLDSIPADSLYDKAVVDLWHWRDARPQPMQKLQANADRSRAYPAVFHVATRQMRRIASDSMPNAQLSDDGRTAVLVTNVPYQMDALAGEGGNDVHLVNTVTGASRPLAKKIRGSGQLSPGAKYVIWWEGGAWRAHDVAANRTRDLTGGIAGISFEDETHDTPSEPGPYGVGGWTTNDARVLIYDRYDIWEVSPDGFKARMITKGIGTKRIRTRFQKPC